MTDSSRQSIEQLIARSLESAQRWQHLHSLVDALDKELDEDPKRLFEMASETISHLLEVLEAAHAALLPEMSADSLRGTATLGRLQRVTIMQDEYDRLKACEKLVRTWHDARYLTSRPTGPAKP